jgi:hypothetical protein
MAFVAALRARYTPEALYGATISGLHLLCSQVCSNVAIPEEYRQYYTGYEQCREAPILMRKVSDAITGKLDPCLAVWLSKHALFVCFFRPRIC